MPCNGYYGSPAPDQQPLAEPDSEERAVKRPRLDEGPPAANTSYTVSQDQEAAFLTSGPSNRAVPATHGAQVHEGEGGDGEDGPYSLRFTLSGHKKSVSSVKFSADGAWMVSACALSFSLFEMTES